MIIEDFHKAVHTILKITGEGMILETDPIIYNTNQIRNPYTYVLHLD